MIRSGPLALALVAAALLSACGGTKPRGCQADGDCPAGSSCAAGVCQAPLLLELASPEASTVVTNGLVAVKVSVTGGDPPALELLRDGVQFATIAPPFEYAWDTSRESEGVHQLVARVVAGARTYDSAAKNVLVDRTPPAPPRIGAPRPASAAPVRVIGTAEAAATVALSTGSGQVTTTADASGAWAVDVEVAAGTYTLTATAIDAAGNTSQPSQPVSLVVDGTRPQVLSREPAVGTTDYDVQRPIRVTFSKPIAAATITPTSVGLSSNGQPITIDRRLSSDRKTLTLVPIPALAVPAEVTVALTSDLQDDAGNALQPPSSAWSFTAPAWLPVGTAGPVRALRGDGAVNSLAADRSGRVYLSFFDTPSAAEVPTLAPTYYVLTWDGSAWTTLGDPIPDNNGYVVIGPDDVPIRLWSEWRGNDKLPLTRVSRWTGSSWSPLGGSLNVDESAEVTGSDIAFDSSGAILVAWIERSGAGTSSLYVRRWHGESWTALGGALSVPGRLFGVGVAAADTPSPTPYVTFYDSTSQPPHNHVHVVTLGAGGWKDLGYPIPSDSNVEQWNPRITIVNGRPLVQSVEQATQADGGIADTLRVRSWDGLIWTPLGEWKVGQPNFTRLATAPVGPVVAWEEGGNIYVSTWTGSSWKPLGSPSIGIGTNTDALSLAVGPNGAPVVAWSNAGLFEPSNIYVRRYNR